MAVFAKQTPFDGDSYHESQYCYFSDLVVSRLNLGWVGCLRRTISLSDRLLR
jgi:hypothetical protein